MKPSTGSVNLKDIVMRWNPFYLFHFTQPNKIIRPWNFLQTIFRIEFIKFIFNKFNILQWFLCNNQKNVIGNFCYSFPLEKPLDVSKLPMRTLPIFSFSLSSSFCHSIFDPEMKNSIFIMERVGLQCENQWPTCSLVGNCTCGQCSITPWQFSLQVYDFGAISDLGVWQIEA